MLNLTLRNLNAKLSSSFSNWNWFYVFEMCMKGVFHQGNIEQWQSSFVVPTVHLFEQAALFYNVSPEFILQQNIFVTGVAFTEEPTVCLKGQRWT